jgi:hypothetical protein
MKPTKAERVQPAGRGLEVLVDPSSGTSIFVYCISPDLSLSKFYPMVKGAKAVPQKNAPNLRLMSQT